MAGCWAGATCRRTRRRWRRTASRRSTCWCATCTRSRRPSRPAPAGTPCVENIDIGGPALIRAAAKNHDHVAVLTDPAQYAELTAALPGGTTLALRRRLAAAAYARTAAYDAAIAAWFAARRARRSRTASRSPARCARPCATARTRTSGRPVRQRHRPGVAAARQVQGKELSFNNLNDTDAALECVAEFAEPTIVIVKHANPCGVASAASLAAAWDAALRCDPVSAFGGIVAANRTLDAEAAERIAAIFSEVIVAPDADADALRDPVAQEEPARAADRRPARPGCARPAGAQPGRRPAGADARCRPGERRRAARRDAARAERGRAGRPAVRVPRLQARQVQRHRLRAGRRHGGRRRRADEPGRLRPDRGLERARRPRRRPGGTAT